MPTNFPDDLDTTAELPNDRADGTETETNHAADHNNLADAVIAIQAELGANPAGGSATVAARLDSVESSSAADRSSSTPAASETLDLAGVANVWRSYVLSAADTVLEFDNAVAGGQVTLDLIQPPAGGKTFSISDGLDSVPVDIDTEADTMTTVLVRFNSLTDLRVVVLGSGPAPVVPAAPVNTVAPAITGTATTGSTLSCSTGTWTGAPAPTYARQWKRAGVNISGATAATYLLDMLDEDEAIKVTVTATNGSGSASQDSNTVTPTSASAYEAAVLADSPAGYWRMDAASGTTETDVAESSDGTYGGTYTLGAASLLTTDANAAVSFSNGSLTVPDVAALRLGGSDITIEAWVKFPSVAAISFTGLILTPDSGFAMGFNSATSIRWALGTSSPAAMTIPTLVDDTPVHLAIVRSGGTVTVYTDGVSRGSSATGVGATDAAAGLTLANTVGSWGLNIPPNGTVLDEVAIYPTALSGARIAAHYAAA